MLHRAGRSGRPPRGTGRPAPPAIKRRRYAPHHATHFASPAPALSEFDRGTCRDTASRARFGRGGRTEPLRPDVHPARAGWRHKPS